MLFTRLHISGFPSISNHSLKQALCCMFSASDAWEPMSGPRRSARLAFKVSCGCIRCPAMAAHHLNILTFQPSLCTSLCTIARYWHQLYLTDWHRWFLQGCCMEAKAAASRAVPMTVSLHSKDPHLEDLATAGEYPHRFNVRTESALDQVSPC